jgi:IS30 family transposase
MGRSYGQLSLDERIEIYRFHEAGLSGRKIGEKVGRSHTTINRELRRNGKPTKARPKGGYNAVRAQERAELRRKRHRRFKLARQPNLRDIVKSRLAMGCSPEQIAGRLALEGNGFSISPESIYRYTCYRSAQKDYWHRMLPRQKARRGHYGRQGGSPASFIKHRRPLSDRPKEAEDRAQPGHWEADFMLFAKSGQNVLVLHERTSRFTIIDKPPNRKARLTARRIACRLRNLPKSLRRTISFDNGTEFAEHYRLHQPLGVETFFCDTHSPWQKGGVENAIGRLRRVLPRKTNLDAVSHRKLRAYVDRLNNTPRKCLDFRTPAEAFLQLSTGALQT